MLAPSDLRREPRVLAAERSNYPIARCPTNGGPMTDDRAVRVGILVDRSTVGKPVRDLIEFARAQPGVVVSLLVASPSAAATTPRTASGLLSRLLFAAIVGGEAFVLRHFRGYREHFAHWDLADLVSGAASPGRLQDDGPPFDMLLDCASSDGAAGSAGAIATPVLRAVLGDGDGVEFGPPGFWECYRKRDATEFRIELRRGGSDHADVLRSGNCSTQFLYSLNRAHLYAKAYSHLQQVLAAVLADHLPATTAIRREIRAARQDTVPGWRHSLVYLAKACVRFARKAVFRLVRRRQRWNLSVMNGDWRDVAYWKSRPVTPPRGAYWADPFLYRAAGRTYCFAEEFVFRTGRGHIAAFELRDGRPVEPSLVLSEDVHLSFPFLFTYGSDLFMCPECSEKREIRLYRCIELPSRWELAKIVMKDVPAADTMIFPRQGKWWLLTNIDYSGIGDYCEELYLFSADSPLDDDWRPHPLNPIKIDCRGGRNGGLIIEGDRLFRVGQRQGFDLYGEGALIYEIEQLTEDAYKERLAWQIDADFRRGLLGVHHLSSRDGITVIDHLEWAFVW